MPVANLQWTSSHCAQCALYRNKRTVLARLNHLATDQHGFQQVLASAGSSLLCGCCGAQASCPQGRHEQATSHLVWLQCCSKISGKKYSSQSSGHGRSRPAHTGSPSGSSCKHKLPAGQQLATPAPA